MKLKINQPIDLRANKRYVQHVRDHSIGDVYDALVELITNADDSYSRLYRAGKGKKDGGPILIEHQLRVGKPSCIVVRDRAEGMDREIMVNALAELGAYSSQSGDRGYMGRGAKDCSALGDVVFESIKDEMYYACRVTKELKFILLSHGVHASAEQRSTLGLPHGNGTSVTLELRDSRLPRQDTIVTELPWHYALRDMLSEESQTVARIRKLGDTSAEPTRIVFRPPPADVLLDENYELPGYNSVQAHLTVYRAPEPLPESPTRFERFGFLIKGERAIHECSLLSDDIRRDPHSHNYFGRLTCPHIDRLLEQYEKYRDQGKEPPPDNPRLCIDPNRRHGLERSHPFVQSLLQPAIEKVHGLLVKEKEVDKENRRHIANAETQRRLDRLAKLASRFLKEQLEELSQITTGDLTDSEPFFRHGVLCYPTYLNVTVGAERAITFYVQKKLVSDPNCPVTVACDKVDALEIVDKQFKLHDHPNRDDRMLGSFRVRGIREADAILVSATYDGLPPAEALVRVVQNALENRDFQTDIEFARNDYQVRQGSKKTLRVFARYPEVVNSEVIVDVASSDTSAVAVRGRCTFTPVEGTNYSEGEVVVEGRTIRASAAITLEFSGHAALTRVKVLEKTDDEKSPPIRIKLTDEPFGSYRAKWADYEGQPNLLLISATHDSLQRYLGPDPYPGQDKPLFRLLLAEIVCESVCRKSLVLETQERPWDFRWADLKSDSEIAESVISNLHRRYKLLLAAAHESMLSDREVVSALE